MNNNFYLAELFFVCLWESVFTSFRCSADRYKLYTNNFHFLLMLKLEENNLFCFVGLRFRYGIYADFHLE